MNMKRLAGLAAAALLTLSLGACKETDVVDGKAELNTPEGGRCYLLEINHNDSAGGEQGESYLCVTKAEWDKNRIGSNWVDANGKRK